MKYQLLKQFEKSNFREDSSLFTGSSELEKDDEDPLSIGNSSIAILGVILASLTIMLPSVSVLLGRPLSQKNEVTLIYPTQKDGS